MSKGPFNVRLTRIPATELRLMSPVSRTDIFESSNNVDFHPKGLFSTEIFGKIGESKRDTTFSYTDIKSGILHPAIYERLLRIRRFYIDILAGKEEATWNPETKDFESADQGEGETGYAFFMKHWNELEIPKRDSDIRNKRIDLINKYKDTALLNKIYIMPAGLRDIEVSNDGRVQEDEINELYRKLIRVASGVHDAKPNDEINNYARVSLQNTFNEVYYLIEQMLKGKKGFWQGKIGKRRIVDGTRNVITSMDLSPGKIDDPKFPGPMDTVAGLWQVSRGAKPVTINGLRTKILNNIFSSAEGSAYLINKETLKGEWVKVDPKVFDRWTSSEGLEKVIAYQEVKEARSKPIEIGDHYLALVYKPKYVEHDGHINTFKIVQGIDDLPEGVNKDDFYPITLMELIYLSNYDTFKNLKAIVTRYPVENEGSTYPTSLFVRTTVRSEVRVELLDDWSIPEGDMLEERKATSFPVFDPDEYIDSVMPHLFALKGMDGDFDGDTVSLNILYSKQSINEIKDMMNTREAHVNPSGGLRHSAAIDTIDRVLYNFTH